MLSLRLVQLPALAVTHHHAERGIADRTGDEYAVAGSGTGTPYHRPFRNGAKHGNGNHDRALCAIGIATEQWTAEQVGIGAQALRKPLKPLLVDLPGQSERQQETKRSRTLRGEVRQVHAQRPASHRMSGILGEKMHPADDSVGCEHQIISRWRREKGCIIGKAESPGMRRKRLEETRDQAVFGRDVVVRGHPCHPAARPNSSARTRRASWSSTALTMPVSSRSTKAATTSAYSATTTRAGTSVRWISS